MIINQHCKSHLSLTELAEPISSMAVTRFLQASSNRLAQSFACWGFKRATYGARHNLPEL